MRVCKYVNVCICFVGKKIKDRYVQPTISNNLINQSSWTVPIRHKRPVREACGPDGAMAAWRLAGARKRGVWARDAANHAGCDACLHGATVCACVGLLWTEITLLPP